MSVLFRHSLLLASVALLSSCGELTELQESGNRTDLNASYYYTGEGTTYSVNPIVATGNENLSRATFAGKLSRAFITDEPYLQRKNYFERSYSPTNTVKNSPLLTMFMVKNDAEVTTPLLQSEKGSWKFSLKSDAFYQVNTFFHLNKLVQRFYKALAFGHSYLFLDSNMRIPPAIKYNYTETNSLWLHDEGQLQQMNVFSKCFLDPINAFFSPSDLTLCFGWNTVMEDFLIVQDPSIIYHEMGHALNQAMLNQRNIKFQSPAHDFQTSLGMGHYDEAGALNEGLSDYFSYFINGRATIGEWGTGRFSNAARPLSESSKLHQINGISPTSGERLSYPNYLHYDANFPTSNIEDVHLAGQIVSHYLVALTEELKSQCSTSLLLSSTTSRFLSELIDLTQEDFNRIYSSKSDKRKTEYVQKHALSTGLVMMLINETFAELGDLFAEGSDVIASGKYFTNLNKDESFLWTHQVNPINFRRFFKILAKNIKHHISEGLCPQFSLDESEQLLDDYGLLLFTSYGDTGKSGDGTLTYNSNNITQNLTDIFQAGVLQPVNPNLESNLKINELNRRTTSLVSKEFLEISTTTTAYVVDNYSAMAQILSYLTFEGRTVSPTPDVADVVYNNNNAKISPGEVVGLALNVKNTSNTAIAGLQILGNDWDHMAMVDESKRFVSSDINLLHRSSQLASFKPCIFNNFPKEEEGGAKILDATDPGDCGYISRTNKVFDTADTHTDLVTKLPKYALDSPQPVCLVQYSGANETKWVTQDYYRKVVMGLEDSKCINNNSMSYLDFNPNECLIRIMPGANQSYFGKVDPQKTWYQTMTDASGQAPILSNGHIMIMEVNKWIEPGTKFTCRFRARFTNCSDCFAPDTNSDDYADYEYAGAAPFKILDFTFSVID